MPAPGQFGGKIMQAFFTGTSKINPAGTAEAQAGSGSRGLRITSLVIIGKLVFIQLAFGPTPVRLRCAIAIRYIICYIIPEIGCHIRAAFAVEPGPARFAVDVFFCLTTHTNGFLKEAWK
jgi:hypothetical protein